MSKIKAKHVFQTLTILFALLAIGLLISGISVLIHGKPVEKSFLLAVIGILFLVMGVVGPLRASLQEGQKPQEIKQTIDIIGWGLPVCGLFVLFAAFLTEPSLHAFFEIASAIGFFVLAYFAFYKLSQRLPNKFLLVDMIHIIKSSNTFGSKEDSIADKEFSYWTKNTDKGLSEGSAFIDGEIITIEKSTMMLSDWIEAHGAAKPLVINFGSYSCSHHRMRIQELHDLMDRWKDEEVNFLTIYTAEAHPEDGWKLENQYHADAEYTGNPSDFCFYQAKTIEDRLYMANWLLEKKQFQMPVVLDNMENTLLSAYNSWPIRLYVFFQGKVAFCGKQGPYGYEPKDIDAVLDKLVR